MKDSIEGLNTVDLTKKIMDPAIDERMKNFEDALRLHSAEPARVFVTINKKHFEKVRDEMEVLTPKNSLRSTGA
ncbi:MAG: hypothetical protein QW176_03995 [Candidatus Bathyarchaeia archaeon]